MNQCGEKVGKRVQNSPSLVCALKKEDVETLNVGMNNFDKRSGLRCFTHVLSVIHFVLFFSPICVSDLCVESAYIYTLVISNSRSRNICKNS